MSSTFQPTCCTAVPVVWKRSVPPAPFAMAVITVVTDQM